jgi:hypothetical protein
MLPATCTLSMLTVYVSYITEMRSRQCIVLYNYCTLYVRHTFVDDGQLNADTETNTEYCRRIFFFLDFKTKRDRTRFIK